MCCTARSHKVQYRAVILLDIDFNSRLSGFVPGVATSGGEETSGDDEPVPGRVREAMVGG